MSKGLHFSKLHGLENDFLVFFDQPEPKCGWSALSQQVCPRRSGIGADGILIVNQHCEAKGASDLGQPQASMILFNADGSRPEMCGNGLRVVCKFLYDNALQAKGHPSKLVDEACKLVVQTDVGPLQCLIVGVDGGKGLATDIRIGVGVPNIGKEPISLEPAPSTPLQALSVNMGNPHCVVFLPQSSSPEPNALEQAQLTSLLDTYPVCEYGKTIEANKALFPDGTNVEFVVVLSDHCVRQRTWERGVGETQACGTGACAVVVAGISTGRLTSPVTVQLGGGHLTIEWRGPGHTVFMTGPAVHVCDGVVAPSGQS